MCTKLYDKFSRYHILMRMYKRNQNLLDFLVKVWTKKNKCSLTVLLSLPFWRNSVYFWFRTAGDRLMNISVLTERCQIKIVFINWYHTCIIPVSAWGRVNLLTDHTCIHIPVVHVSLCRVTTGEILTGWIYLPLLHLYPFYSREPFYQI